MRDTVEEDEPRIGSHAEKFVLVAAVRDGWDWRFKDMGGTLQARTKRSTEVLRSCVRPCLMSDPIIDRRQGDSDSLELGVSVQEGCKGRALATHQAADFQPVKMSRDTACHEYKGNSDQ